MSEKKKNNSNLGLHIITPFIVAAICCGISVAALIKPYDKMKVYLNLAFMDDLGTDPSGSSGLVITESEITDPPSGETYSTGEVVYPSFGEMYAIIKSDKLTTDVPVYWGSKSELLEKGACQANSSSVIGNEGNSVISAHVDTFFADLSNLEKGDTVTVNTNYGSFVYTVRELIEFSATDKKYVTQKTDNRLTLYTCKRDVLGNTDKRIGVICDLTESRFYSPGEEAEE